MLWCLNSLAFQTIDFDVYCFILVLFRQNVNITFSSGTVTFTVEIPPSDIQLFQWEMYNFT